MDIGKSIVLEDGESGIIHKKLEGTTKNSGSSIR